MAYVRESTDTTYRGRRRLSGNYGRVYVDNSLIFELSAFEAKITFDREDIIIGNSKDSKITGLSGEGSITIKKVFNRGFKQYLSNQKSGHDVRFKIVAALADPDALNEGEERVEIDNCWLTELDLLSFNKGEVLEVEIPFNFSPEDVNYLNTVEISNSTTTTTTESAFGTTSTSTSTTTTTTGASTISGGNG